jgi:hypothetical protein
MSKLDSYSSRSHLFFWKCPTVFFISWSHVIVGCSVFVSRIYSVQLLCKNNLQFVTPISYAISYVNFFYDIMFAVKLWCGVVFCLQTQHIFTIKLLPEKKYLCLTFNRQDKNKILNILQNINPLSTWFEETQTLKINLKEIRCNNGVKCLYRIISINNVANDSLFLKCYFCWLSTLVVMIWLFSCISVFWPWIGIRWINMYVRDTMQNYQWFGHI